jgi:hypothetical protein
MHRWLAVLLLVSVSLSSLPAPIRAQTVLIPTEDLAAGFNPNDLFEDSDLFEFNGWNEASVQQFLVTKQSPLATMLLTDIDGQQKRPSTILWRVASSYKINPRYLLVLIQKEQSLVEDPHPSQKQFDWAAGFGVCDSCAMDDPRIQAYKGFASQLEYAAKQHRERYLLQILSRGSTIAGYAPGKPAIFDGLPVTPVNQATAMLYSYTPHIHGNLNAWRIWRRWFSLSFPEGTLIRTRDSQQLFLIRDGKKRPIASLSVAASLTDPKKIVSANEKDLLGYNEGSPVRFANYSLVETETHQRYLLVGAKKRLIKSLKAFDKLGFNEDEVLSVQTTDLAEFEDGPDLTSKSTYPTGALVKDGHGDYWYLEDTIRKSVPPSLLKIYFPGRPAKKIPAKELLSFTIGDPYQLHDGELIRGKTNAGVYVIEHGQRRPIPSASIFEELGWSWKNVLTLPDAFIASYPIGDPVDPHAPILTLTTEDATDPLPTTVTSTLSRL